MEEKFICKTCKREYPLAMFKVHSKDGYREKICKQCKAHKEGRFSQYDRLSDDELKEIYNKIRSGKMKQFPPILAKTSLNKESTIMLVRYLFFDILGIENKQDLLNLFEGNILKKEKLNIAFKYISETLMVIISECFPEYDIEPWDLKNGNIHGMYDSVEQRKKAIERFLNDLVKEGMLEKPIDIIFRNDIYKLIQTSKVPAVVNKFNKSSIYMLMWYFNNFTENRIYEWDFVQPPRGFWSKEKNCIRAFKTTLREYEFYKMPLEEQKEFIRDLDKKFFLENSIAGALQKYKHFYNLIEMTFEKKYIYKWELKVSRGVWDTKKERISHMKELIEDVLRINKQDIPKFIKQSSLKGTRYNKFAMPCTKYYNGNYYEWINECYPEEFTKEDFEIVVAKDGMVLDSNEELLIYEYIKENVTDKIEFIGRKKHPKYHFRYNGKEFRPDFVIENLLDKPIIIEHFGYYQLGEDKDKRFIEYRIKSDNKIKYFTNNNEVYFISLFPNDICFGFKGVQEKFNLLLNCI